jgi:hypothetical protein
MEDHLRALRWAAGIYALGLALHTFDHLRRGLDASPVAVLWAGNLSTLLGVAAIVLVFAGHRWAPAFAAITGIPVAIGVAAVHLLPPWGALSESFLDGGNGITAMSWVVVMIEIVGAFAMGVAGLLALRDQTRKAQTVVGTARRSSTGRIKST